MQSTLICERAKTATRFPEPSSLNICSDPKGVYLGPPLLHSIFSLISESGQSKTFELPLFWFCRRVQGSFINSDDSEKNRLSILFRRHHNASRLLAGLTRVSIHAVSQDESCSNLCSILKHKLSLKTFLLSLLLECCFNLFNPFFKVCFSPKRLFVDLSVRSIFRFPTFF